MNQKIRSAVLCMLYTSGVFAAEVNEVPTVVEKSVDKNKTIELDEVEVKAKRRRIITPLPGLPIDRETATTNIQSATDKEIADSKAINVTDFLNSNMQSVNVNDYSGNPFQQDLNFRGFTASPQIGTAEGISVYLDGVRINEPFGEVVNWDLIPMNAISTINLIPGSNPMFGLNTIGGALAITTKDGFKDHSLRTQQLIGSWGREQTQFSNGFHGEQFALFTAYNHFKEDGWRVNSPSNLRQLFNKATARFARGEINLTSLNVDTSLTGNGVVPIEMYEYDQKQVFTSPDQAKNQLEHYNLDGSWYVNDKLSLSAGIYRRNMDQNAIGTDIYQGYKAFQVAKGVQTTDDNADNIDDLLGRLTGVLNQSTLKSRADGFSFQLTYEGEKHQLAAGLSIDENNIAFRQSQTLGELGAQNNFILASDPNGYYTDPANGLDIQTSLPGVIRNNLKGSHKTEGLFASDTWTPIEGLNITFGARMNWAHVQNSLISDRAVDFYQYRSYRLPNTTPAQFVTFLNDPRPEVQACADTRNLANDFRRFVCTTGDYKYRSFNPSVGLAWEAKEKLTVYGNLSRGSRVPSVIELGCAKDDSGAEGNSRNFQFGCSIPTSLTADPYLKQVRSTSYETGLRGYEDGLEWNLGIYRTDLKDDILFVPLGQKNRGVFDNFGKTRREGVEMGFKKMWGKASLSLNYTWLKATFESPSQLINDANSSNTETTTNQAFVNIEPGDQMPGMPNHVVQLNFNYSVTPKWDTALSMVAHSFSYVRGNENNEHRPREAVELDVNNDGVVDRDRYDFLGPGKTAGYAVFNLRTNYRFDNGVSLFARVDNLLDKEYATAGNLGRNPFTPQGAFKIDPNTIDGDWKNSTFISPGAPRAAWVGISFDWDWDKVKKSSDLKNISE